ncbi:hypothetical protein MD484_g2395, partial [Candolleomyces efflorescens]
MRNLSLIATEYESLSHANTNLTATAFDLDENVLYAASERKNLDGEVEVELWKVPQKKKGDVGEGQAFPVMTTMFTSMASSNEPDEVPQIVSLRVIAEARRIAAIMRGGDVVVVSLDEEDSPAEVEGTFETGILAASWSPDESLLVLVTGDHKLILMTSTFDVLSEGPVHQNEFGEDAPINVGWGSKQTQFHGSLGKTAAQAPTNVKIGSSPDDDSIPRVSWRGDGAYFVVSILAPADSLGFRRRVLRVYDRQASLQSTSEAVGGLEHALAWRPSGNLIASTQRFGFEGGGSGKEERHDVVFFERNGLRHGEFTLKAEHFKPTNQVEKSTKKWGYKVRDIVWSADSNVLGLWVGTDHGDIVQLWTIGNYHWYLKHELIAPEVAPGKPGRFTSIQWHPEATLQLILTTPDTILHRHYDWETFSSPSKPPQDSGLVAVLDASSILLTPFRTQNVPPPMSSHQLAVKAVSSLDSPSSLYKAKNPVHVAFSADGDALACLWEDGLLQLWALNTRLGPGPGKVLNPSKIWEGKPSESEGAAWRHVSVHSDNSSGKTWSLAVLGRVPSSEGDVLGIINLESGKVVKTQSFDLIAPNCRIVGNTWPVLYQTRTGGVRKILVEPESRQSEDDLTLGSFPEFCLHTETAQSSSGDILFVGLAKSGRLYVFVPGRDARILATNANSFTISSSFVVLTTTSHESKYVPISELLAILSSTAENESTESNDVPDQWTVRKVERGSRIVVAVPSTMSLVLQMPRGNLETINPRPLVMEVVTKDLNEGNYRKAFFACRKHRIDLNVLVDHDQEQFLDRVPQFVEQIHEIDHLNLFLTLIGRGNQAPEVVIKICDAVRIELEKKDLKKYINTILTAHVVKNPPDYESGLAELLRLRETDQSLVEEAVKYIIFLVDAEKLFDIALGMYDFSLVLMIAQHAQKDPREYLPFLKELRSLEKYYQRFRIDDHLKRHESALKNLSLGGPQYFEEAVAYIERYSLYEAALSIWKGTDQYKTVMEVYGDWLYERRELPQAAAAFLEAGNTQKAMVTFEKNLQWRELFDLAFLNHTPEEELQDMAYRVSEDLTSKKRYAEAGQVLLEYRQDVRGAVYALVQGNAFSEARRVANLHKHPELLEDVIRPASLDSRAQIAEDINEMREQLRKQRNRIRELRIRKVEEPEEVRSLLPHLYQFDGEYREEGLSLQADVTDFEKEMKEAIEEVWTRSPEGADPSTATAEDTWASRMAEVERNKHINPLDKVSKPDVIRGEKWKINLYEF